MITNSSAKSFERGVYELSSTSISFNVCFAPVGCLNRGRSNFNLRYKSNSHSLGSNHHRGSACARRRSNFAPGRRLEADWYLKSMTMTGATPANDPRNGITVKSGDRVTGLTITLATGAAGLKGKIIPAGGARLPSRLHAHLVPAAPPQKMTCFASPRRPLRATDLSVSQISRRANI